MAEQWFSIVEYARTYSVSDMTVRRRIKTGKLHAVLKEGKYFIPVPVEHGAPSRVTAPEPEAKSNSGMHPTSGASALNRRSADEMFVVKGHPNAQRTFGHVGIQQEPAKALMPNSDAASPSFSSASGTTSMLEATLGASIRSVLEQMPSMLGETRASMNVVHAAVRKLEEAERRLSEQFDVKARLWGQELKAKNMEINQLRQQIDDLQLLVQIIEKKKTS